MDYNPFTDPAIAMTDSDRQAREAIADIINSAHVALLTTVDFDGTPWTRPMGLQDEDFDGTLRFFTMADAAKVDAIVDRPTVGVTIARPDESEYVVLAGRANVSNDRETIRDLWSEPARAWFPDGPDSPELRLIVFDAERGEYWSSPGGFVTVAYGYARAALTGEPADDLGENAKVAM
jgi:general stress protein 26